MIPSGRFYVEYSYRSFGPFDKTIKTYEVDYHATEDMLSKFHTIDLSEMDEFDKRIMISRNFTGCANDIIGDNRLNHCFFFNTFCIKTKTDTFTEYYVYILDKKTRRRLPKDHRVVTVYYYKYDENSNLVSNERYRIKIDHIFQVNRDTNRTLKSVIDDSLYTHINLYILPVYMYDEDLNMYIRISDKRDNWDGPETKSQLHNINNATELFLSINYMLIRETEESAMEEPESKAAKDIPGNTNTSQTRLIEYVEDIAISDKEVIVKTKGCNSNDKDIEIKVKLNGNRNQVTGTIRRKICAYRYTVCGHWHNYWCGTGKDRHLEKRWIESYDKNKDKTYRINRTIVSE